MKITLERIEDDGDATLGILRVNGVFECFTLEDEHRDVKVRGETRIPAGTYEITLRTEGGMSPKYAARYGSDFHKGMLWLREVPGFSYVYIHTGNNDEHTEGCILVGDTVTGRALNDMAIGSSRDAYRRIYKPISQAILRSELVEITITDKDK